MVDGEMKTKISQLTEFKLSIMLRRIHSRGMSISELRQPTTGGFLQGKSLDKIL